MATDKSERALDRERRKILAELKAMGVIEAEIEAHFVKRMMERMGVSLEPEERHPMISEEQDTPELWGQRFSQAIRSVKELGLSNTAILERITTGIVQRNGRMEYEQPQDKPEPKKTSDIDQVSIHHVLMVGAFIIALLLGLSSLYNFIKPAEQTTQHSSQDVSPELLKKAMALDSQKSRLQNTFYYKEAERYAEEPETLWAATTLFSVAMTDAGYPLTIDEATMGFMRCCKVVDEHEKRSYIKQSYRTYMEQYMYARMKPGVSHADAITAVCRKVRGITASGSMARHRN